MKKLGILMAMFLVLAVSVPSVWAADVEVNVEGAYTENDLAVYIYADIINGLKILSSGVRLTYLTSELTLTSAEKNEAVWFLGSETYMDPDTTTPGEVVFICGKLDESDPLEGVSGDRVLLGKVRFNRTENSMPFSPTLNIGYAHGTGLLTDDFKNFVDVDGNVLDGAGVDFVSITVRERGDADTVGGITMADAMLAKHMYDNAWPYVCFADAIDDEEITMADAMKIKYMFENPGN